MYHDTPHWKFPGREGVFCQYQRLLHKEFVVHVFFLGFRMGPVQHKLSIEIVFLFFYKKDSGIQRVKGLSVRIFYFTPESSILRMLDSFYHLKTALTLPSANTARVQLSEFADVVVAGTAAIDFKGINDP